MPIKQKARLLSLALREAEIVEDCITNQGIRLNVRAVAAFKVGDDPVSIANAARRFLSEQDRMEVLVGRVAEAYKQRTLAEADANRSRAASLADGNQELIVASRIVEALPSLVASAAQGIADSNLTILNGTEGVSQVVAGLVGQGLSILDTLKKSTAAVSSNGPLQAPPAVATDADRAEEPPVAQPTQADGVRQH
jgi:uncharacterized membrane protein YqiK